MAVVPLATPPAIVGDAPKSTTTAMALPFDNTPIVVNLPDIAQKRDVVSLGILSIIDIAQTQIFLHTQYQVKNIYEQDPVLGKHPSLLRMLATGALVNFAIDSSKSKILRKTVIQIEGLNIARNFRLMEEWRIGK